MMAELPKDGPLVGRLFVLISVLGGGLYGVKKPAKFKRVWNPTMEFYAVQIISSIYGERKDEKDFFS